MILGRVAICLLWYRSRDLRNAHAHIRSELKTTARQWTDRTVQAWTHSGKTCRIIERTCSRTQVTGEIPGVILPDMAHYRIIMWKFVQANRTLDVPFLSNSNTMPK